MMHNLPLYGIYLGTFILFIFSTIKIRKEQLSVGKYLALVFLPTFLFSLWMSRNSMQMIFLPMIYGTVLMLPSLLLYAITILLLEKKFSPPAWKLSIWTGLVAGLSALPYGIAWHLGFLLVPIITGTLSMVIISFFSGKKKV